MSSNRSTPSSIHAQLRRVLHVSSHPVERLGSGSSQPDSVEDSSLSSQSSASASDTEDSLSSPLQMAPSSLQAVKRMGSADRGASHLQFKLGSADDVQPNSNTNRMSTIQAFRQRRMSSPTKTTHPVSNETNYSISSSSTSVHSPRNKSEDNGSILETRSAYDPVVFDVLDVSPQDLAQQLSLIDCQLYKNIPVEELLSLAWTHPDRASKAPHIVAMTQRFNHVAVWVTREVLDSNSAKRRLQKIAHFIRIAKKCYQMRNFNGVKCLLSGLQSSAVYRLERTWTMLQRKDKKSFDRLCYFMSMEDNCARYRRQISKKLLPCVPYLGIVLSDVTFLNTAKMENDSKMSSLIQDFLLYQQSQYPFAIIAPLSDLLMQDTHITELHPFFEEDSHNRSHRIEPRAIEVVPNLEVTITRAKSADLSRPAFTRTVRALTSASQQGVLDPRKVASIVKEQPAVPTNNNVNVMIGSRQGFLMKKEEKKDNRPAPKRTWQHISCLFTQETLHFKSKDSSSPEKIPLSTLFKVSIPMDYKKRPHVLRLEIPEQGRILLVQCESETDREGWMKVLQASVDRMQQLEQVCLMTDVPSPLPGIALIPSLEPTRAGAVDIK